MFTTISAEHTSADPLAAALGYAERGWRMLPLDTPDPYKDPGSSPPPDRVAERPPVIAQVDQVDLGGLFRLKWITTVEEYVLAHKAHLSPPAPHVTWRAESFGERRGPMHSFARSLAQGLANAGWA